MLLGEEGTWMDGHAHMSTVAHTHTHAHPRAHTRALPDSLSSPSQWWYKSGFPYKIRKLDENISNMSVVH